MPPIRRRCLVSPDQSGEKCLQCSWCVAGSQNRAITNRREPCGTPVLAQKPPRMPNIGHWKGKGTISTSAVLAPVLLEF